MVVPMAFQVEYEMPGAKKTTIYLIYIDIDQPIPSPLHKHVELVSLEQATLKEALTLSAQPFRD